MTEQHNGTQRAMSRWWPVLAITAMLVCSASPAWAQEDDYSFGVDEAEKAAKGADSSKDDTPSDEEIEDGYSFGVDEANKGDDAGGPVPTVAVVAVPSAAIDGEQRAELQQSMISGMGQVAKVKVTGPDEVLSLLTQEGDIESCVAEPLCLSEVGRNANVNRILIGRVKRVGDSKLEFDMDYFDVEQKLFLKNKTSRDLSDFDDVQDAVQPSIKDIFGIRDKRGGPQVIDDDPSLVQPILAWSAAGLAAISLGVAIYTGLQVSSEVDTLEGRVGQPDLTQQQAREEASRIGSIATRANIFYGLAAGLAITAGILFFVDFGSDVASEEELKASRLRDIQVAPAVSADGLGFGASFRF